MDGGIEMHMLLLPPPLLAGTAFTAVCRSAKKFLVDFKNEIWGNRNSLWTENS